MEKTCPKCSKTLPVSEFHRNRARYDGLQHQCKACAKAHALKTGRTSGRNGVLWALNAEGKTMCSKCDGVFLLSNMPKDSTRKIGTTPDCYSCRRLAKKDAPSSAPERQRAYSAKFRKSDKGKAALKKYYETHKDEIFEKSRRRRAALRGATIEGTKQELKDWCRLILNDPCAYCGGPSTSIDHVVPIDKGGVHGASNLVGACERCNKSKSTESLLFFLLRQ